MKYFSRTSLIVLTISTTVLLILIPQFLKLDSTFRKELLWSEIIGICVEGFLFVGILESVANATEIKRIEKLRKTLLSEVSFLAFVLRNCILNSKLKGELNLASNLDIAESIEKMRFLFPNNDSFENEDFILMAKDVSKNVRNKANLHLDRLRILTPVAAEISEQFLSQWLTMTDKLNDLAQKEEFDIDTLKAFPGTEWTYPYNRIPDLFKCFADMNVPSFR